MPVNLILDCSYCARAG